MAYVDPNDNILKWENGDVVTPQAAKMNMHLDSVGTVTNALRRRGTYTVNNIPERTALVNTIGASNISNSNPLMVWRANADAGKRLEYTENGGTWHYVKTSQEVIDTGWVECPTSTGYDKQGSHGFLVRRIDDQVFIRWGVSATGMSAGSSNYDVATLPNSTFYPIGETYCLGISNSAARTSGARVVIIPDGKIQVRNGTTGGGYVLAAEGSSWFVGPNTP